MQKSEGRMQKGRRATFCRLVSALCILNSALFVGCAGYQVGHRSLYRPDIRTVHVPVVQSDSFRRYLGERLTEHDASIPLTLTSSGAVHLRMRENRPLQAVFSRRAGGI